MTLYIHIINDALLILQVFPMFRLPYSSFPYLFILQSTRRRRRAIQIKRCAI